MRLVKSLLQTICIVAVGTALSGCVTVGDFRREMKELEQRLRAERAGAGGDGLADLVSRMDSLTEELRALRGRVEVSEKRSADALAEARKARQAVAATAATGAEPDAGPDGSGVATDPGKEGSDAAELVAYREAYAAWRDGNHTVCIDRFREFLQAHPASLYADDAAFWMADCHYKQGDFKNAVLRFDDVVRNYPDGNKAPDALYRQGESLLKLGPGYHAAAKRAFERVIERYPDSARAAEAGKQLKLLAAGDARGGTG